MFNVFVDDLSYDLSKTNVGCYINSVCINHLLYADDAVLVAPSPYALQMLINTCEIFAKDNDMCYNVKKTVCMHIVPKSLKNIHAPNMYLNGRVLKWVVEHKYLGIFISNDSSDARDITRQIRSTYSRGNVLISKFRMCSDEVKVQLFRSFCSNLYCSSLWTCYTKELYNRMRVAYNNIFRVLLRLDRRGSISMSFVLYNIDSFSVLIRKNIFSLRKRIQSSFNTVINACMSHNFFNHTSKINKKWCLLLFNV